MSTPACIAAVWHYYILLVQMMAIDNV